MILTDFSYLTNEIKGGYDAITLLLPKNDETGVSTANSGLKVRVITKKNCAGFWADFGHKFGNFCRKSFTGPSPAPNPSRFVSRVIFMRACLILEKWLVNQMQSTTVMAGQPEMLQHPTPRSRSGALAIPPYSLSTFGAGELSYGMAKQTKKRIAKIKIEKLNQADYNPRVIDEKNMRRLQASIREYTNTLEGWSTSDGLRMATTITVNRNGNRIVGGHQRVKALAALGQDWIHENDITWVDIVPDSAIEKALNVALNNREMQGDWDGSKLAQILEEIKLEASDLYSELGYELLEPLAIIDSSVAEGGGMTDPDAIPEPPDKAKSEKGCIYILGNHRLMCGDSSSPADLDKLLGGEIIHLVNMDPPYNVKVEPRSNNALAASKANNNSTHHQQMDMAKNPKRKKPTDTKLRAKDRPLMNDFVSDVEFDRLLSSWFGNVSRVLKPGRSFYIWGGYANFKNYVHTLESSELFFSQAIVWVKDHPVLTRKDFMGDHEWCFYGWKNINPDEAMKTKPAWKCCDDYINNYSWCAYGWRKGAAHWFNPEITNARDVWNVQKVSPQSMVHLTEKPVELAIRAMQYSSRPGENVLDLFGGSGSTMIAAEKIGRCSYLMELDSLYCDVIRKRWAEFTNGEGCNWEKLTPMIT